MIKLHQDQIAREVEALRLEPVDREWYLYDGDVVVGRYPLYGEAEKAYAKAGIDIVVRHRVWALGPHTEVDHVWTRREAIEIYRQLGEVINKMTETEQIRAALIKLGHDPDKYMP